MFYNNFIRFVLNLYECIMIMYMYFDVNIFFVGIGILLILNIKIKIDEIVVKYRKCSINFEIN